jgi:hypothetical protein
VFHFLMSRANLSREGEAMLTTAVNELALMRWGGFRLHSGGDGFALFLIGLVALCILIWALWGPGHKGSTEKS